MIHISEKTLADLEFPKVREQLSEFCVTDSGKRKALKIKPFKSIAKTLFALQQTKEYKSNAYQAERIPNHGFENVDKEIHLLGIDNSTLELRSFRKIASLSETANAHLLFFRKHEELYPCLFKTVEDVEYTTEINDSIAKVIDRYGEVRDQASPLLQQIRQALNSVKAKIDSSFSSDLNTYHNAGYLDEIRESVIDNQRVLAVSATYKKRVKGAVLGRSKTGSIIFIQPENTLNFSREYNNLKFDEKEEINRILKELTNQIRPFADLLEDYQRILTKMDVVAAKVSYGNTMDAVLPKITKKRELELKEAYHPLLLLNNKQKNKPTFPQDINLNEEDRIIVISGPNAGGKSITLKTIGLLQVMLQSGMLVPVHEFSRMCFFTKILSDIGDNQSIENHLSTYSYRLKNMRHFLQKCDASSLFLIDEFGTGSDPELGGALAEAFLEVFYERKSYGVITTHYANLKKMANETPGIRNANMRFDSHSLEPEYKLQMGEAGSSFTFEVAQKMGIPYSLINRAKKKVERGKIRFDRSIAKLQKERTKLVKTTEQLEQEKQKAAQHKEQLTTKSERVQQKLEDFQELFDYNQRLILLGQRFDKISEEYFYNKDKKSLIGELMRLVTLENARRTEKTQKESQKENKKRHAVMKEAVGKVKSIRERKKKEEKIEKQKAKKEKKKSLESLEVNDHVRIEGSRSVGILDRIEKGKAIIDYGMFTTEVDLTKIEFVKKGK